MSNFQGFKTFQKQNQQQNQYYEHEQQVTRNLQNQYYQETSTPTPLVPSNNQYHPQSYSQQPQGQSYSQQPQGQGQGMATVPGASGGYQITAQSYAAYPEYNPEFNVKANISYQHGSVASGWNDPPSIAGKTTDLDVLLNVANPEATIVASISSILQIVKLHVRLPSRSM